MGLAVITAGPQAVHPAPTLHTCLPGPAAPCTPLPALGKLRGGRGLSDVCHVSPVSLGNSVNESGSADSPPPGALGRLPRTCQPLCERLSAVDRRPRKPWHTQHCGTKATRRAAAVPKGSPAHPEPRGLAEQAQSFQLPREALPRLRRSPNWPAVHVCMRRWVNPVSPPQPAACRGAAFRWNCLPACPAARPGWLLRLPLWDILLPPWKRLSQPADDTWGSSVKSFLQPTGKIREAPQTRPHQDTHAPGCVVSAPGVATEASSSDTRIHRGTRKALRRCRFPSVF